MPTSASRPRNQVVQPSFNAGFPLLLPPHPMSVQPLLGCLQGQETAISWAVLMMLWAERTRAGWGPDHRRADVKDIHLSP